PSELGGWMTAASTPAVAISASASSLSGIFPTPVCTQEGSGVHDFMCEAPGAVPARALSAKGAALRARRRGSSEADRFRVATGKLPSSSAVLLRTEPMIEVQYVGQLGNNLFQYALGRILAEKLGMELRCAPAPGHETGHSLDKVWRNFADCPQHIPGLSYCGPDVEEVLLLWHRIDVAALLARREPRHIVLRGWFQR